jgi:hypothetical protein
MLCYFIFFYFILFIFCSYGLIVWELLAGKTIEPEIDAAVKSGLSESKQHTLFTVATLPQASASHPLCTVANNCLQGKFLCPSVLPI